MFDWQHITVYFFLAVGAALSYYKNKLTLPGSITAMLVGLCVYTGAGITGLLMLLAFFLSGTWATRHKWEKKQQLKLTEQRAGARNSIQVLANGGVSAALGITILFDGSRAQVYILMMASSLASATADTFSSELGNVYGKKYFNILNFKKDNRGFDGVISVEGLVAGAVGSLLISFVYAGFYGFSKDIMIIFVAGLAGNLFDSFLGAVLQRKGYISNDMVNLLNTVFALLLALLILNLRVT